MKFILKILVFLGLKIKELGELGLGVLRVIGIIAGVCVGVFLIFQIGALALMLTGWGVASISNVFPNNPVKIYIFQSKLDDTYDWEFNFTFQTKEKEENKILFFGKCVNIKTFSLYHAIKEEKSLQSVIRITLYEVGCLFGLVVLLIWGIVVLFLKTFIIRNKDEWGRPAPSYIKLLGAFLKSNWKKADEIVNREK